MLQARGVETEPVEIRTTGDLAPDTPVARLGSRALFTRQLDDALLAGRIDLAVHSLKDLPTELPGGLALAAVSEREDPRDALVGRGKARWSALPPNAVLATGSLRRRAQLLARRPDLQLVDLRGNVDTRLAKLDGHPEWTAIVIAAAGLIRLGLAERIGERLPPDIMLPAPGQGALAVTMRAEDEETLRTIRTAVHHEPTALTTAAERGFLRRLEGGCQVPVAAYGELAGGGGGSRLRLRGRVLALNGEQVVEGEEEAAVADEAAAEAVGASLAERLLAGGARTILTATRQAAAPGVAEP